MRKTIMTLGFSLVAMLTGCGLAAEDSVPEAEHVVTHSQALNVGAANVRSVLPPSTTRSDSRSPQLERITAEAATPVSKIGVRFNDRTISLSIKVSDSEYARLLASGADVYKASAELTADLTQVLQRTVDSGKLDRDLYQGHTLMVDRNGDSARCWKVYDCDCTEVRCFCVLTDIICL